MTDRGFSEERKIDSLSVCEVLSLLTLVTVGITGLILMLLILVAGIRNFLEQMMYGPGMGNLTTNFSLGN